MPISAARDYSEVHSSDLRSAWLIAWRAALESLRDLMTLGVGATWALVIPYFVVIFLITPQANQPGVEAGEKLTNLIATYFLLVGIMPSSGSLAVASGLFAGEKEHGTLLPLLATPASNFAIFAGKVLGAVLPSLLYATIAELTYLAEIWLLLGASTVHQLPLAFSGAMLALVPVEAVLGAALASLISSRVRTYQSAQMLSSLVLYPVMATILGIANALQSWRPLPLLLVVGIMIAFDVLLIAISAATWRREDVLARR